MFPFIDGHHLVGVLVVRGQPGGNIDDEDISLFCQLVHYLNPKSKKMQFLNANTGLLPKNTGE